MPDARNAATKTYENDGEGVGTAKRSDSLVQPMNQRLSNKKGQDFFVD
ncbi:MAG TPA: hypothetical protein VK141_02465 [Nitrosomonas sp.]|nr:hypothetical protein [Nitrosomonas sp.]